jgi:glycerophosphoryl diester phosphodiesterase
VADPEFEKQTVPTLCETLDLLSAFDGRIYVELKSGGPDILPLCTAAAEIINASSLKTRIIVKSFRLAAIPAIRLLCPGVTTAALFEPGIENILIQSKHILAIAAELGATELSLHRSLATIELVAEARGTGFPVLVWTVDEPDWIRRAVDSEIYALIVNDPRKMMEARRDLSSVPQPRTPG